jgi:hypothetical protein
MDVRYTIAFFRVTSGYIVLHRDTRDVNECTTVYIDVIVHLRFEAIYIAVHQITRWCNATHPHVDRCEIHHCVFSGYIGLPLFYVAIHVV